MLQSMTWLILFGVLLSNPVRAFTLFGDGKEFKGWNTKVLSFHLNPSNCPANVQALLDEAINVWNQVPTSSIQIERGDETDITVEQALNGDSPQTPSIHCVTNMSALNANPNIIPGFATGFAFDAQRRLAYGVLVLNAQPGAQANIETMDEQLVVDVIAHEIGHVLGLGHTTDKTALMYPDASLRKKASLSQDDVDGMTYLYPRDELGEDGALGCGVLALNAGGRFSAYMLLLLPLLMVLLKTGPIKCWISRKI